MPTKFRLSSFIPTIKTHVNFTPRTVTEPVSFAPILLGSSEELATPPVAPAPESVSTRSVAPMSEASPPQRGEVTFKGGHHEELKKGDIGFNMSLSGLEKFAQEQANAHAQAGLPRMNAEASEELPIEAVLRARAAEIFVDWKTRCARRVQDALQAAVLEAGNGVVALRHAIDQAKLAQYKTGKLEIDLRKAKALSEGRDRSLTYGAHLSNRWYGALVIALIVIEWVANVAVFRGLLPPDKGTEQAMLQLFAETEDNLWLGGFMRLFGKALIFPEAALLALGTIVILIYLTHVCGESRRQLVAFRQEDDPGIAHGLTSRGRQAKGAFWKSFTGIAAILIFLVGSRQLLGNTAESRVKKQTDKVFLLEDNRSKAQAVSDISALSQANRDIKEAKATQEVLKDNADFGEAISSMNLIIIALNIGLITVAIVAAYQASEGRLSETRVSDPAVMALESSVDLSLAEIMAVRHKARTLDLEIQANIARARYLSTATPSQDWAAKVERLNSVVALFRTENAFLRGIDVQNILSFAEVRPIDLDAPELQQSLVLPPEFHECEREYIRLRSQLEFLGSDILTEKIEALAS